VPTYLYKDPSGNHYEVVQKITEDKLTTLAQVKEALGKKFTKKDEKILVQKLINCEGGVSISGAGVYKQGPIATTTKPSERLKAGVTKYTIDEVLKDFDEGQED
jgi:predicted nucleic acid-binding Zn ribbon protein